MPSNCILGVIVAILVALVAVYVYTRAARTEHFEEGTDAVASLDATFLSSIYQRKGVDRCDALFADPVARGDMRAELSEKALQSMDNFVLGYRVREWIPADAKQQDQGGSGKQCFFYFDSNNNAIDPILQNNTCDMRNPVFQGVPFIKGVFTDSNADIAHTLPYTKCVVDIDPDNVNTTSLNNFWSRMGAAQCSKYQAGAQAGVNNLVSQVTACNNELRNFESLDPKYKVCMQEQQRLQASMNETMRQYTLSNCAFSGSASCSDSNGSLPRMSTDISQLRKGITETQALLAKTNKDIEEFQRKTRGQERRLTEMNLAFVGLSNDYVRCIQTDLPETRTRLTETRAEFARLTNTSNILARQHNLCMQNLTVKRKEYEDLITRTNRAKALYDGSNSQYVTCMTNNDRLRNQVATLKDQFQKLATQCNECTSTLVLRTAEEISLQKDVTDLTAERDEWLRRCTYDQKQMLDLSINTINQLRASATQYTRQNCGNDMEEANLVNDLIQKKFEAIAKGNAPLNCESEKHKRAQCCGARGLE